MDKLQVILLEDVSGLGSAGDIVSVAEGYARNALFPEGKAALATDQAQKSQQDKEARLEKKSKAALQELQDQAAALDGTELVIEARVKDGNEIFGSITAQQIAKELQEQAKIAVKAKDVGLDEALTTLGSVDVTIDLGSEVEATVRVTVVADPSSVAGDDDDE